MKMPEEIDDDILPSGHPDADPDLRELWMRVCERVRMDIHIATVWIAMQEVVPIAIDENRFVAGMSARMAYLSINLEDNETVQAIEDALNTLAGHPLIFQLIEGETRSDWETAKIKLQLAGSGNKAPAFSPSPALSGYAPSRAAPTSAAPSEGDSHQPLVFADFPTNIWEQDTDDADFGEQAAPAPRMTGPATTATAMASHKPTGIATWDQLQDWVVHDYKHEPTIRYPHGQARHLLRCIRRLSDVVDALEPKRGPSTDQSFDRGLGRALDKIGQNLNLDPIFIALQLWSYRQAIGRSDID